MVSIYKKNEISYRDYTYVVKIKKHSKMEASKIFRFEFSESLVEKLGAFSKQNEMVDRETYKDEWKKWLDENQGLIEEEDARLKGIGYQGNIQDKMYKSSRYYFRKKSTAKKAPVERKKYVSLDKSILLEIDRHILNNIGREDFKPSIGFAEFCESSKESVDECSTYLEGKGVTSAESVREKIKKTYKNRYFVHSKKSQTPDEEQDKSVDFPDEKEDTRVETQDVID